MNGRRPRQPLPPIRHPFLEIAGAVYMMRDWFELDDGDLSRDCIVLVRLTASELRMYDEYRTTSDAVGNLLPLVQRRLARRRRA